MRIIDLKKIKTASEARQFAIDWQSWQSKRVFSYLQIYKWQYNLSLLAKKFGLIKEFKENAII